MTFRPSDASLLQADLIPQAEIQAPLREITRTLTLREDSDDLHDFVGGAFWLDDLTEFTIKRYAGGEDNLFTLYFPRSVEPRTAAEFVLMIVRRLDLPRSAIRWAREAA